VSCPRPIRAVLSLSGNNRKEKHFDLNRVAQHKVEGVQWERRAE
jgi:hypothetical protein